MGTAVDVGDAATGLSQSRADADATAKAISGGALTAPDTAPAPPLQIGRSPQVKPSRGLGPPPAALTAPTADQPNDADSIPHGDLTPPPPPTPELTKAKPGAFDQSGSEFGNGIMRGFAELGRAVALSGAVPAMVADKIHSWASGKDETGAQDTVFKAIDDYANTAVNYWKPEDQSKSGLGAQVLGDVAGVVPALTTGGAALPLLTAQATTSAGIDAVQSGQDAKTAAVLATVAGVANALGMKIPLKSPNIWKRIGSSILGNETISAGTQALTKMILSSNGYKEAADKIDMTDPRSILSTLAIAIGFGLHRQSGASPKEADQAAKNGTKVGQPPAPDASLTAPTGPSGDPNATPPAPPPPPSGTDSAPPQPPGSASAPVAATGESTAPAGEQTPNIAALKPAKDVRAEISDMNNKETPRQGVLISPESLQSMTGSKDSNALSVNGTLNQARIQNRTVQLPQGELMLKTSKLATATNARLKAGEDPQAVIDSVTTGVTSAPTSGPSVVVQGKDAVGNVASEAAVAPEAAHVAAQKMVDQGKTPEIKTPEDAQSEKLSAVSAERNTPTSMGIMTNADGTQSAVHIVSHEDGVMKVQRMDSEGELETKIRVVDPNSVKVGVADTTETKTPPASEAGPEKTSKQAVVEKSAKPPGDETPTEDTSQSGGTIVAPANESGPGTASEKPVTDRKPLAEREGEAPKATEANKVVEPPSPPKLKAAKIETALEALPKALENHEQQEQIPEGKKFAGSVSDRQENASLFAHILKSAADSASGKAEPSVIERALKAAKAAERLAEKGKEETAKGQGTGHVRITALVNEMHKAARGLLGDAREGDHEVVTPKAAELRAKTERQKQRDANAREAAAKPKVAEEPKSIVRTAAAKPAQKTEVQVQRDAARLMDRYTNADEASAPGIHTEIEQFLHEHMSDKYTPDEIKDVLHLLYEQRIEKNPEAARGPRKMSDTLEDETTGLDTSPKGLKTLGLRTGSKHMLSAVELLKQKVFNNRMGDEWQRLSDRLRTSGTFKTDHISLTDTGRASGAHEVLDKLIAHADTPVLKSVLENLRKNVPDVPVHFVSDIQDLSKGQSLQGLSAAGLFSKTFNSVQVKTEGRPALGIIKTLVHELAHAATAYEVHDNPNGLMARGLEAARQVLQQRLANRYGQETIEQHRDYFNGKTQTKPADYMRHLYGIANIDEMMAELHVNPDFVQEITDSEKYAGPSEPDLGFMGSAKTLLGKMYNAIGRFLGISDPKLLQHIADLTSNTMETQKSRSADGRPFDYLNRSHVDFEDELIKAMQSRYGANPLEISRALPAFREMAGDPAHLVREGEVMRALGDEETAKEPTMVARLFRQAMNSGAVDAVRAVKTSLKTVPQIFRDHRRDFGGRDDPSNPLNRLQDVNAEKTKIIHDMSEITRPVAKSWMKLSGDDNKTVGALLRDATMYKLDPRKDFASQIPEGKDDPKAAARHAEFEARLKAMSPEAQKVFSDVLDTTKNLARAERRANIDAALESFSDTPISDVQRTLLYGARNPEAFEELVGPGKLIDMGENNDKLKSALNDFAGQSELNGPYAHLGRHGEYVVSAEPEGTRKFADEASARKFAKEVGDLSPGSKGTYVLRGAEHQVDYKVQYTSFHETRGEAESELARMKDAGYSVGMVTRKTMSREDTPLSAGTRDLVAAAESKINRNGKSVGNDALIAGLRSAFLQLAAQRSAYAGSRMARKNFAGVKPEEMRRNFADHAQSTVWHTAQLRTTFKQAAALAKLRDMARDAHNDNADQQTMYRRGEVVSALNAHLKDEVANFGHRSPFNTGLARLGFMSYLASPSHAFIWMTQNFTTGIPVAGARWGYGRAASSFGAAMKLLTSPTLRTTIHAIAGSGDADAVNKAILDAVKGDKRFGKWAQGPNSHMQQLVDRGVLGHSYSNELHQMAQSGKSVLGVPAKVVDHAFEWARLLPNMADSWNRVSTALAGLEMTGGDIRKTSDFVDEIHADYSSEAKPMAFKKIGRVPGMNSVTMFKTYTQAMIHLFYGNLKNAMTAGGAGRMESAKAAAGMVVANAMFAGVYGAAALEPLRLAVYAYHKLFDKEGEVFDLKNAIHRYLVDHLGKTGGDIAAGGLPHIAGFDLSNRMGLADLFFHEPPDLFSADKDAWKNFVYNEAGPMVSFLAERTSQFVGHMQKGEAFQAVSSLVPVKMYQDAVKASQLMTTGKQNALGGQMTKPSALDAAYQMFGLKPSSVADAQERTTVKVGYNAEVKATRDSILKAFVSAAPQDRAAAQARINEFNRLHPAEAIKPQDQIKMMKYRQQSQSNQPGRDTTLNKMLSY